MIQKSAEAACLNLFKFALLFYFIFNAVKNQKLRGLKHLRQPALADSCVFLTCCFKFIQQKVEN